MKEFTTKTGANVVVSPAPWPEAKRLKKAIQQELAAGANMLEGIDLKPDSDVSGLLGILMKVDGSDAVDAALWPCLARCTRNGDKITEAIFDAVEARADYYEIVVACVKENLGPLAAGLSSALPANLVTRMKRPENTRE